MGFLRVAEPSLAVYVSPMAGKTKLKRNVASKEALQSPQSKAESFYATLFHCIGRASLLLIVIMHRTRHRQLEFTDLDREGMANNGVGGKVAYNGIPAKNATFKSGLGARVHRWFRLTPSFGPDLVQEMFAALKIEPQKSVVLDPFAGASTTLIECQLEGIRSFGFEINPLLHFVGRTSLDWDIPLFEAERTLSTIQRQFCRVAGKVELSELDGMGLKIPPIHNPTRWWRPDVLADLVLLKNAIQTAPCRPSVRDFFLLTLAGVLVPDLTNVTFGRLQLHFIDRSDDVIDVWKSFVNHAKEMLADLTTIQSQRLRKTSNVYLQDATDLTNFFRTTRQASCVITSPPYPNRYSYVWNTRPHLYMLDFFSTPSQASELDQATIGGTWGTATSMLLEGTVSAEHRIIREVVEPVASQIRSSDNLMANYLIKYFNFLSRQIVAMEKVLAPDARLAYVVGCSRLKGVYVETDVLLGELIEGLGLGYRVTSIERIRKRHSGKDLHESIVYAWKKVP